MKAGRQACKLTCQLVISGQLRLAQLTGAISLFSSPVLALVVSFFQIKKANFLASLMILSGNLDTVNANFGAERINLADQNFVYIQPPFSKFHNLSLIFK